MRRFLSRFVHLINRMPLVERLLIAAFVVLIAVVLIVIGVDKNPS